MLRAVIIFLLILGVVYGGLSLLRKTAGTPKKHYTPRPESEDEDDRRGW